MPQQLSVILEYMMNAWEILVCKQFSYLTTIHDEYTFWNSSCFYFKSRTTLRQQCFSLLMFFFFNCCFLAVIPMNSQKGGLIFLDPRSKEDFVIFIMFDDCHLELYQRLTWTVSRFWVTLLDKTEKSQQTHASAYRSKNNSLTEKLNYCASNLVTTDKVWQHIYEGERT